MNTITFVSSLSLLLLAPSLSNEAKPVFAPEDGTTVTKTFSESAYYSLDALSRRAGGQELGEEIPEMNGSNLRRLVVTDTYVEVMDGQPMKLERNFDELFGENEISLDVGNGAERYEYELASDLQEAEPLFTWNKGSESYDVTDREGESQAIFEGLSEDMDLRGMLPAEDVELFDSWKIAPEALIEVLRAGGDTRLAPKELPEDNTGNLSPLQLVSTSLVSLGFLQEATGEVSAIWEETTKKDGAQFAIIAIEVEIEAEADVTDRVMFMLEAVDVEPDEQDLIIEIEVTVSAEGQLIWNLDQDRFESFELTSEIGFEILLAWKQDMGGNELEIEIEASLSGESKFEAQAE